MAVSDFLQQLALSLGGDFQAWLRAWARVLPLLVLVPVFGGSALPAACRAGLAVALAAAVAPAIAPLAPQTGPLWRELALQLGAGVPVAAGAALLVHVALMAGGAVDDLRGARERVAVPTFADEQSPFAALFGLLVALALLRRGIAAELVLALLAPPAAHPLLAILQQLTASVGFAVAVASPIVGAAVLISAAEALIARAATPAHVSSLLAPLRGVLLLGVVAVLLDRLTEAALLVRL